MTTKTRGEARGLGGIAAVAARRVSGSGSAERCLRVWALPVPVHFALRHHGQVESSDGVERVDGTIGGSAVATSGDSQDIDEVRSAGGRWLWIPPTLILLGIGVFALVQALPHGERLNRQERLAARANAVCATHKPEGLSLTSAVAMTAGSVTATARFLHNSPAPWDKLPGAHFVAWCSYSDPKLAASSEYVPCRIGGLVSLYQPTRVLVDEHGRSSPDSVTPDDC